MEEGDLGLNGLDISWDEITGAFTNPTGALDDGSRVVAARIVTSPAFQAKLFSLGQMCGHKVLAALSGKITSIFYKPPPEKAPPSGTWESDVLQPMISPIMAGLMDVLAPYFKVTLGVGLGMFFLSHIATYYVTRTFVEKVEGRRFVPLMHPAPKEPKAK